MFCIIRYQFDQMFRTCRNTFTTGFTYFFVNLCDTVYDMDRVKRTSLYTAAISKTAIVTGFWSAIRYECHCRAIFHTGILIITICLFTVSCTFYKGNLFCAFFCLDAHDLTNFSGNRSSTDRTLIDRSFTLYDCSSKTGTSGITTTTTVVSRKNAKNGFFSLIYFYFELFSGDSKEKSNKNTYASNYNGCSNNRCYAHFIFPPKSYLKIP